jgi:putative hydrolase
VPTAPTDPRHAALEAIDRAMYLMDRALAPSQKVRAFKNAAAVVADLPAEELVDRVSTSTLTDLEGIGPSTGSVISDAVAGRPSPYLEKLDRESIIDVGEGAAIRAALRGDCHSHSTWSDGGAPIETMVRTAMALGHEYLVVTDHSPRLTIAHGLSPERLESQLDEIDQVQERVAPFRILRGMEVDILEDGALDLPEELLARLDIVVASVHSKLSMAERQMTERMVLAVSSPHVDILGHCTGRKVVGGGRAPSKFDADLVFAACAQFDTAVEINCRPERQDPPDDLLDLALDWGCLISIDTDAHAPGQLEWQAYGCDKAARHGIDPSRIVNTWTADELVAWAGSHRN